jgi:hypothetical protein
LTAKTTTTTTTKLRKGKRKEIKINRKRRLIEYSK